MKKIFMAIVAVAIASASFAQGIEVTETQNVLSGKSYFKGNVGIGASASTSYGLWVLSNSYFNGNAYIPQGLLKAKEIQYTMSCSKASDKRFKKNIKNLPNETVSKLKQIESKTYQYKSQDELLTLYQSVNGDTAQVKYFDTNRDQYGFLAQDFENVFPELVYTDSVGLKSIDYISLIPILLQAIQEQQAQIDYLLANAEIKTNNGNHNGQDNGNGNNKNNGNNGNGNGNGNKRNGSNNVSNANTANGNSQVALKATKPAELEQNETENENALFQNTPNPFSQETQIEYTLANDAQNAMICIYNMNGEQLRCFPLNIESSGVITIEGNDLKAGMYLYSLLVDDQLIDTKRMVLTF
ncbi:MAG: tail fiber domain-containing protein [Salinivirgaceae bacterium]|nr:tail fiber domain-containing protein [Salinivirgaceae bacterium]